MDSQTRSRLSCDEVDQQSAAYVWGALELAERAAIEAHRRECSRCHQELLASERVIARLDAAGPKVEPPPELRGKVLAALETAPVRIDTPRPSRTPVGAGIPEVRDRRARPLFTGMAIGSVATLAAAAMVSLLVLQPGAVALLGSRQAAFAPGQPGQSPPVPITIPGSQPTTTRLIELRSSSGSGRGALAFDSQTHRGVLMLQDVPAPADSVYGVWLVQDSQRVEIGRLTIQSGGFASFVLPEALPLERPDRIEVGPAAPEPGSQGGLLSADL